MGLLDTAIINEAIGLMMLFVRRMRLATGYLPYGRVNFGEESIGLLRRVIDVGHTKFVR